MMEIGMGMGRMMVRIEEIGKRFEKMLQEKKKKTRFCYCTLAYRSEQVNGMDVRTFIRS